MTESLRRHVQFAVVRPVPGDVVNAVLTYDPADPAVIHFDFTDGKCVWAIGRDLLRHGLKHVAGLGDVLIYGFRGECWIELSTPDGRCGMHTPAVDIADFLASTYQMVADGAEWEMSVDQFLGRLFAEEAS